MPGGNAILTSDNKLIPPCTFCSAKFQATRNNELALRPFHQERNCLGTPAIGIKMDLKKKKVKYGSIPLTLNTCKLRDLSNTVIKFVNH
jgi:hypothetical protein